MLKSVTTKLDKAKLTHYVVCVCSCRTSAVTLWAIWSSGCICPPWLPRTASSWLSPMCFHTTWVALPRDDSGSSFRSHLTCLNCPTGHRRELQCAEWSGTAEGQTERRALPSSWRHDAEWRTGESSAGKAATKYCLASIYMVTCRSLVCTELQQVMVHRGRLWSPAAFERAGCHHSRQPQSSWWFFQKSESNST